MPPRKYLSLSSLGYYRSHLLEKWQNVFHNKQLTTYLSCKTPAAQAVIERARAAISPTYSSRLPPIVRHQAVNLAYRVMMVPSADQTGTPRPRGTPLVRPGPLKPLTSENPGYVAPAAPKKGPISFFMCNNEGHIAHQCSNLTADQLEMVLQARKGLLARTRAIEGPVAGDPLLQPRRAGGTDARNQWGPVRVGKGRQVAARRSRGRFRQGGRSGKRLAGVRRKPPPVAPVGRGRTTGCADCFPKVHTRPVGVPPTHGRLETNRAHEHSQTILVPKMHILESDVGIQIAANTTTPEFALRSVS